MIGVYIELLLEALVFPTKTISPNLALLDQRIAPLVHQINIMGLATYYSCEGHGAGRNLIQSSFPMVVISPNSDGGDAVALFRFMMMLGMHNDDPKGGGQDDVKWGIFPRTDACTLMPINQYHSLEVYHRGIDTLVSNLQSISKWYDRRKDVL